MKLKRKWIARGITLSLMIAVAAAFVFLPSLRGHVHRVWHRGMELLNLETAPAKGATFWCPMHPSIRRKAPGACPI